MSKTISRRGFMQAGAGLAASGLLPAAATQAPAVRSGAVSPVVIASGNGHQFRNGGKLTCVETAFEQIVAGKDVLDAVIAGVNIVELDPADTSVGYGGLPNADGVVQGRKQRGDVCGLQQRGQGGGRANAHLMCGAFDAAQVGNALYAAHGAWR